MRARTFLATALLCLMLTATFPVGPSAAAPAYGWSAPYRLSETGDTVSELEVVPVAAGGALAAWTSVTEGAQNYLSYAVLSPTQGWSQAWRLTSGASQVSQPRLSVNSAGYGLLTWLESTGVQLAMASFFQPATGFTRPHMLNQDPSTGGGAPASALDESGASTATWAEFNGSIYNRLAARGDALAGTWAAPTYLEFNDSEPVDPSMGAIAANATGGVLAVWEQTVSAKYHYHSSTYTPGVGWSPAVQIENSSDINIGFIKLAVLTDGRAVASWLKVNASGLATPEMTTYSPTTGWAGASRAFGPPGESGVRRPFLSCGGVGSCVAGWIDWVGVVQRVVVTRSTDGGATFSPPEAVEPTFAGNALEVDAALGPTGEGLLVWSQDPAPATGLTWAHAYAAPISAQTGLGATVRLDQMDNQRASKTRAAVAPDGRQFAGWMQNNGIPTAAFMRSFVPLDVTAPTIRITSPANGSSLTEASAVVTGVMDGGTTVVVNGIYTPARKDGSFTLRVPLSVGPNVIRASAQDDAGNSATATVNVTVVDVSTALAADLAQANLTIMWLLENQTNLYLQLAAANASLAAAQSSLGSSQAAIASAVANVTALVSQLAVVSGQLASAQANASAAQTQATQGQAATQAQLSSSQGSASTALVLGAGGMLVGALGAALAMNAIRNMKRFGRGGGGGSGGSFGINEQGIKRSEPATGDLDGDGRDEFTRGPRQSTSVDGSYDRNLGFDSHQIQARHGESDLSVDHQTPKRDFGDRMKAGLDTAGGALAQGSAPRDAASGQATGKRQHGALPADEGIGSQGSDGVLREAANSPRDSASGQATGKRQHGALPADEGIGSQGSDGVLREAANSPRDSASGQTTGKRQHGALPAGEGIGSQGSDGVLREAANSPRDAGSGKASGRTAAPPTDPGSGDPAGLAIGDQGAVEDHGPKKRPK